MGVDLPQVQKDRFNSAARIRTPASPSKSRCLVDPSPFDAKSVAHRVVDLHSIEVSEGDRAHIGPGQMQTDIAAQGSETDDHGLLRTQACEIRDASKALLFGELLSVQKIGLLAADSKEHPAVFGLSGCLSLLWQDQADHLPLISPLRPLLSLPRWRGWWLGRKEICVLGFKPSSHLLSSWANIWKRKLIQPLPSTQESLLARKWLG